MNSEVLYQYSQIVTSISEAESKVEELKEQYKGYRIVHSMNMIEFPSKFKLEIVVYNEKINSR